MINFFNVLPIKNLTRSLRSSNGRNARGKITAYHRGGGVKRRYRLIDFKRSILEVPGFVRRLEFDPVRNSYIALICYANGILSYVIAAQGMFIGSRVLNSGIVYGDFTVGSRLLIKSFPIGSFIHNIELTPGRGGQICRSAGTYAQVLKKVDADYVIIKLKSGEHRLVNSGNIASVGIVSNSNFKNMSFRKAGQSRMLGKRPIVRGVAMNPIDHPHGGNTSGGRPSVSPWGKLAKGGKTRNTRKNSSKFILKKQLI